MSPRFLRSKRLRSLLWYAADGCCGDCGVALEPGWHADHVQPWSVTKRTNVHEMQALCGPCNERKGVTVLEARPTNVNAASALRRFQSEMDQACREIQAGARQQRRIVMGVTPGGGKQFAAVIAAHRLIPAIADAFCWIVPRVTLQRQAEEAFADPWFRSVIGHTMRVRQSTNEYDPSRGMTGFVTTYQAVPFASNLIHEFDRKRYVLFLDENHHVDEGGVWHRAIQPLIDRAAVVIFASGTMERGDGKPIANIPYIEDLDKGAGFWKPQILGADRHIGISYGRSEALGEHAIKPLQFFLQDASARWIDRDGRQRSVESIASVLRKDASAALMTALTTEAADTLLNKGLADWLDYRKVNARAKLLIVIKGLSQAKRVVDMLIKRNLRAGIATSDDSAAALDAITRFKFDSTHEDRIDALVTVQMAYEGMDCPAVTHLICLTHIRSRPWIEQMLARAGRVDKQGGPWETQFGYIYAPDDPLMQEICTAIRLEQAPYIHETAEAPQQPTEQGESSGEDIVPIQSTLVGERVLDFTTGTGTEYGFEELLIEKVRAHGLQWVPLGELRSLIQDLKQSEAPTQEDVRKRHQPTAELPPSVEEKRIREAIRSHVARIEGGRKMEFGTINREIYRAFGIAREDMKLEELQRVWVWVNDCYPLDGD